MKSLIGYCTVLTVLIGCCTVAAAQETKKIEPKVFMSRQLTVTKPCDPNAHVFIENIFDHLTIRTNVENEVRLVATVNGGKANVTDSVLLRLLHLSLEGTDRNVALKTLPENGGRKTEIERERSRPRENAGRTENAGKVEREGDAESVGAKVVETGVWVQGKGMSMGKVGGRPRLWENVVVYVPAGVSLELQSEQGDITIEPNLAEVRVKLSHSNCSMQDASRAHVDCMYGTVHAGNILHGDFSLINGSLIAKSIRSLTINSQYATVDIGSSDEVKMVSHDDEYDIYELGTLTGEKHFGHFRVAELMQSMNLTGTNADVRVRHIDSSVREIWLEDKYADIQLPIGDLPHYTVAFKGQFCRWSAPFLVSNETKGFKIVGEGDAAQMNGMSGTTGAGGGNGDKGDSRDDRSVGGLRAGEARRRAEDAGERGLYTHVHLDCTNCTIDLK